MPTHPLEEPGVSSRFIEPCILVIFGATGDLTARKLFPAIYNLAREGQLPSQFACVGFARRDKTHDQFRDEMHDAINKYSRIKPVDEQLWKNFKEQIFYHRSEFHEQEGYTRLNSFLKELDGKFGTKGNRVFYLSTQPSFFPLICENLEHAGLIYDLETTKDIPRAGRSCEFGLREAKQNRSEAFRTSKTIAEQQGEREGAILQSRSQSKFTKPDGARYKWSRIIIEKPFGHDLDSAKALQKELLRFLDESQIYRIDHYLGKETVQNILVFRFANSLFESVWNNRHVDHVQISVAEDIGIGTRGAFWEEAGLVRDIVQNHMMQLLSLVAMEPPVNLSASAIHDEKVKVLQAIRLLGEEDFEKFAVRGQYGPGYINGQPVVGYRQEDKVSTTSNMETYAALRLSIDNWRWSGVPFYLRGGKRLPKRATEIAIVFKDPPGVLFQQPHKHNEPNVLSLRIQPDEGTGLKINCKVPGPSSPIQPVKMDFRYGSYFGTSPPEAYERLIQDCILGDNTLFAREDEVFNSWRLLTPLLNYWAAKKQSDFPNYQSGTWGPKAAEDMLARDQRKWRLI